MRCSASVRLSTNRPNGPNIAPASGAIMTRRSAPSAKSTLTPERNPPSTYRRPLIFWGARRPGTADDAATRSASGVSAPLRTVRRSRGTSVTTTRTHKSVASPNTSRAEAASTPARGFGKVGTSSSARSM